jgi:hypothetical protein
MVHSEEFPVIKTVICFSHDIGNPRRSYEVAGEDVIHVQDDDDSILERIVPEPVAGTKRPFSDGHSSDELNIKARETVSPLHQPSKYPFTKDSNKPTRGERNSGLVPDGKNTIVVDERYGDDDVPDSIENYDSDREVQHLETGWSESIMREAQSRETRGSVRRIVDHFEDKNSGPKVNLSEEIKKKSKNMKPNVYSSSLLSKMPLTRSFAGSIQESNQIHSKAFKT